MNVAIQKLCGSHVSTLGTGAATADQKYKSIIRIIMSRPLLHTAKYQETQIMVEIVLLQVLLQAANALFN